MKHELNRTDRLPVMRIVAIYAVFGILWIYLSDSFLGAVVSDPEMITRISVFKGIFFIAVTVLLLYQLIARYITDIKRANAEIQRLASFPQLNPHPVLEVNPQGEITFCNQAALDVAAKMGHPDAAVFLPDDLPEIFRSIEGKGDATYYREIKLQDSIFAVNFYFTSQFEAARLYASDITERKRAEDALRKANEELEQRVAERTAELVHTVNYLQEEVIERELTEEALRESEKRIARLNSLYSVLSKVNEAIVRINKPEELYEQVCRITVEDGLFAMAWIGITDPGTRVVKPVVSYGDSGGYLNDISICAADVPEGRGPTGKAVFDGKYSICGDIENDPRMLPWRDKALRHGFHSSSAFPLRAGGAVIGAFTIYGGSPQVFTDEEVNLLFSMAEDISFALDNLDREARRREAERALQEETVERLRAMEELREKERMLLQQSRQAAMGEMIGNIAHQWRQPLNTLGLIIQELQMMYEQGEFSREYLEGRVNSAKHLIFHMSQTIDDFRNFFRPDKEKMQFDVKQVVTKTVSLIEGSFKSLRIVIEVGVTGDPVINGYPNEYSQVLLNILINARDAFSEHQVDNPKVTINVRTEDGKSVMTVIDNAGGIPEDIMYKIFDPYFTTKGPDMGTGVGLFMSKTIIEKNMNGTLTARNTGDGAEFRIEV